MDEWKCFTWMSGSVLPLLPGSLEQEEQTVEGKQEALSLLLEKQEGVRLRRSDGKGIADRSHRHRTCRRTEIS